jgi:hypothetical protein
MNPDLLAEARALRGEVRELRSAVREVVAILENWTQTADRNHAVRRMCEASRRHPPR